jgi:hypothetical protein
LIAAVLLAPIVLGLIVATMYSRVHYAVHLIADAALALTVVALYEMCRVQKLGHRV